MKLELLYYGAESFNYNIKSDETTASSTAIIIAID